MQINNCQSNTNFTAFKMPQSSHKRFMRSLRNECSVSDLIRIRNTMENQVSNKNHIYLEDLGYMAGFEVDGHLMGIVKNKTYFNSNLNPFNWKIPNFIEKLAKKANKAQLKDKLRPAIDNIEECRTAMTHNDTLKAQRKLTKTECANAKAARQKGIASADEQKSYLLGEIYKLIGGKRK